MDAQTIVIHAKLVAYQESTNGYINYVFWNIESDSWDNQYIMCVRYPNWDSPQINIDDEGYLSFTEIVAGTKYFNSKTNKEDVFLYNHIRFNRFIKDKNQIVKVDNLIM